MMIGEAKNAGLPAFFGFALRVLLKVLNMSGTFGHRGEHFFATQMRMQIVERQIGHGLARLLRGTANVRRQHHMGQGAQFLGYVGFVFKHVQAGASYHAFF